MDEDEKMTLNISEGHSGKRSSAQMRNYASEASLYSAHYRKIPSEVYPGGCVFVRNPARKSQSRSHVKVVEIESRKVVRVRKSQTFQSRESRKVVTAVFGVSKS